MHVNRNALIGFRTIDQCLRNRWFVLGRRSSKESLVTLALDRIQEISIAEVVECIENLDLDAEEHFKHVIGVTVEQGKRPHKVHLKIDRKNAPFVITKPLHPSQEVLSKSKLGIDVIINVQLNYELERELLGFGESILVISPIKLRNRIHSKRKIAACIYDSLIENEDSINEL